MDLIAQVGLDHDSALPADKVVNTWSFKTFPGVEATIRSDIASKLQAFYVGIQTYLSANMAGTGLIRFYDRAATSPRVPLSEHAITFTPGTAGVLPGEVAACLSFHAAYVSGQPRARFRGRIYLGQLGGNAGGNGAAADRPVAAFMSAVQAQAGILLAADASTADWNWNVWSEVDGLGRPVVGGWIDNAFDTVRSRGGKPTSRTTFGV